jgi:hypothetical protein
LTGLELNPQQKEEVATYAKNLDDARNAFQGAIQLFLASVFSQSKTKTDVTNHQEIAALCNSGVCRPFSTNGGIGPAAPAAGPR